MATRQNLTRTTLEASLECVAVLRALTGEANSSATQTKAWALAAEHRQLMRRAVVHELDIRHPQISPVVGNVQVVYSEVQ